MTKVSKYIALFIVLLFARAVHAQFEDIFADLPTDNPNENSILKPGEKPTEKIEKNIFIQGEVSKKNCYAGEPILLSYYLYSSLLSSTRLETKPALPGFVIYEIPVEADKTFKKKINNKSFTVFNILKYQIIPVNTGELQFGEFRVVNTVNYFTRTNERKGYSGKVTTEPMKITVTNLPERKKPANFAGAIGSFILKMAVVDSTFPLNENNSLLITIDGAGSFLNVDQPAIDWPADLEHFTVLKIDSINMKTFPSTGKKIFKIPFIAVKQGKYLIPGASFSFFDPSTGQYKTVYSDSIKISVLPAAERKIPEQVPKPEIAKKRSAPWIIGLIIAMSFIAVFSIIFIRKKNRKHDKI